MTHPKRPKQAKRKRTRHHLNRLPSRTANIRGRTQATLISSPSAWQRAEMPKAGVAMCKRMGREHSCAKGRCKNAEGRCLMLTAVLGDGEIHWDVVRQEELVGATPTGRHEHLRQPTSPDVAPRIAIEKPTLAESIRRGCRWPLGGGTFTFAARPNPAPQCT